jgi:DNA polymerase III psi subunit
MSLDNIQMSTIIVQDLYKKTLVQLDDVQLDDVQLQASKKEQGNIPFLGKNEQNILIVVNEQNAAYLPDEDLALLMGILTACKLSMADVAIVNAHQNKNLGYNNLIQNFAPTLILLFGIQPVQLDFPLQFPNFQLQRYNHQTYISSPAISALAANVGMKKQLWASLQQYFFN